MRTAAAAVLAAGLLAACSDDPVLFEPDDGSAASPATAATPGTPTPTPTPAAGTGLLEPGDLVAVVGDSLPVLGDPPWPALLADRLDAAGPADVTVENFAVPGTTVPLWSPGSELFADRLEPALADEDLGVLLVQLGGNDLQRAVGGIGAPADLAPADLPDLDDVVGSVVDDLTDLLALVAERRPDVEVLVVGYPDYSRTDPYDDAPPAVVAAVREALTGLDDGVEASGDAGVVRLVDRSARVAPDVDDLLRDRLHLDAEGHALVADVVADALLGA